MAQNPYVNKVVYGNDTLVDLTEDSVTANTLLEGETAHNAAGAPVTGTAKQGHIIWNAIKTALSPQRLKLWFADAKVTDDSTEQATKVEVVQLIDDESELTNAPDGVYQGDYDDAPEDILDASMVAYGNGSVEDALDALNLGSVSITADGTETYNTLLNSFFALIDESKLSPTSYLTFQNQIYRVVDISVGYRHIFIRSYFGVSDGKSQNWQIELRPSLSTLVQQNGDGNIINYSSAPPNVGDTFTLYY